MEPLDKELGAEISRRSPRLADPCSNNCESWTPPPSGIATTREAFDIADLANVTSLLPKHLNLNCIKENQFFIFQAS